MHHLRLRTLHWAAILIAILLAGLCFFGFAKRAHSRIGIIDTHEHIGGVAQAEALVEAMDELGIEKTIIVPSPEETLFRLGADFTAIHDSERDILNIAKAFPERFIPFCSLDPRESDALVRLKDCVARGGRGLKLYNGHPLFYPIFGMSLDDKAMEPIFDYAEETRLPILFHVNLADYGTELERVLKAHPGLTVSVPHFMASTNNLKRVAALFDQYPNLYTDISFGFEPYMAEGLRVISRKNEGYRDLIARYPDRILFGGDLVLTSAAGRNQTYIEQMLGCYLDLLEKNTYACGPATSIFHQETLKKEASYKQCKPQSGKYCQKKLNEAELARQREKESKALKGLWLDPITLEKIYKENAERFLGSNQL